ncbi:hypothetical protein MKC79_09755 [[Clostridium] innocuum]|nr:hypothetical protein [[Clostridium] innocuum]
MNMVQYDLQFATVSVPAEVSHEEIRTTVANVVTDAGSKAKNTATSTAKGIIDSIGIIALIVCVFLLVFGKKGKALEIVLYVVLAYLVITKASEFWAWLISFVK